MHGRYTGADYPLGNSDPEVLYVGEGSGEVEAGAYISSSSTVKIILCTAGTSC